jgi:hypothetical protein
VCLLLNTPSNININDNRGFGFFMGGAEICVNATILTKNYRER